ncbi:ABC transporter permease [Sporolactobacillus sp. THM7-4]|nr:ABC transporter permease [Sporolactobacillus sp. THM7-4]
MAELNRLWEKRRTDNFQMQLRYWNLIGKNSGLMFVLYAMIIIGGFYYKRWLDGLPEHFPGLLLISVVLSALSVRAPVRTFIQKADQVFLLPVEPELGGYFRSSRIYSFLVQSFVILVAWIVCMPLFFQMAGRNPVAYFLVLAAAFIVKGWNIDCRWQEQSIDDLIPLKILRGAISFLFLYSVTARLFIAVPAACLLIMLLSGAFLFHRQAARGLLKWDRVLDMENKQAMKFLRFANLFTDVPQLKHRIRARKLISSWFPVRSFDREHVYDQIFVKTFLRADDYFGIFARLTIIGMLVSYFIGNGFYTVFIVAATVYLTGLQLLALWKHPLPQALAGMYPVSFGLKRRSFVRLLFALLVIQTVALSAAGAAGMKSPAGFFAFLAAGLVAGGLFSLGYTARRIAKENR